MTEPQQGFPGGSVVRNPSANAADAGNSGLISGLGRPPGERKKWQLIPIFLPGKFHGEKSLAGYSPWGRKRVRHDLVTTPPPPP